MIFLLLFFLALTTNFFSPRLEEYKIYLIQFLWLVSYGSTFHLLLESSVWFSHFFFCKFFGSVISGSPVQCYAKEIKGISAHGIILTNQRISFIIAGRRRGSNKFQLTYPNGSSHYFRKCKFNIATTIILHLLISTIGVTGEWKLIWS